ncbi:hypothetical protein PENTCL1PPCAC_5996 [Pristionchus entomophagus]|uniref:Uncharacterized protein n=1 Tax=Pristionchus entomophagus TaxID=358040 RepID=A0AAV5SKQ2_9BILA|nr:hypothetical protein PENTCL1PPCAC_5996 [Pristionchus entomophagus]
MIEEPSRNDSEELASLRKRRRLALYLAESGRLPDAFALTFDPPFTAKQLPALATLCETRGFKDKCFYEYSNRGYATIEWKRDLTNTGEIKTGKVTDLASLALKEGKAYMMSVDTVVDQLKKRELREQERYLVEGLARMEMIEVKREKEADSLRESLLEWMEDAETLVKLNDWDSFFSVVSKIHKDEDVFDSKIIHYKTA